MSTEYNERKNHNEEVDLDHVHDLESQKLLLRDTALVIDSTG